MNEIAGNQEFDNLVSLIQELEKELSELVYERDNLIYHICPTIKAEYMLKIGKIEYAIFEYHCKILRTKRKIEIVQAFINREQTYNIDEIEKQLDKEYEDYIKKLLEKQREIENARIRKDNFKELLPGDSVELKKLYTLIVKKLHPDINPDTTEEQHRQFNDAVNAYKNGDLAELKIIYLLLEKILVTEPTNSMEKLIARKEMLLNEKEYLLGEVQRIRNEFPYNIKELIENKEKLREKVEVLSIQLTECHEQYNEIEKRLEVMLKNE